jgi:guanylate kinase
MLAQSNNGILFVLSAPSGAGKTTIALKVLEKIEALERSVSHTTRPMRDGEVDGIDYHFIGIDNFHKMVDEGRFLEWAKVHGYYYGTSIQTIEKSFSQGMNVMLVIDTQGAATIREKKVANTSIFLLPPSIEELEERLRGRKNNTEDEIRIRLAKAASEIAQKDNYDYQVVNDIIDNTVMEVCQIINGERGKGKL